MAEEETVEESAEEPETAQVKTRPVVVNVLGVANGAAQAVIDGVTIRNLMNVETEHNPEGTTVIITLRPDIFVQELLTEELLERRLADLQRMSEEKERRQQFVNPEEGLAN